MNNLNILNLTPHKIVVYSQDEEQILLTIEPQKNEEGKPLFLRAEVNQEPLPPLNGFPVHLNSYGVVEGMPDPKEGTVYVVSQITATALKAAGRADDVYIVDKTVRDSDGRIVGCKGFAKV